MNAQRLRVLRVSVVGGVTLVALAVVLSAALSVRQRLLRVQYEEFHDAILGIPLRTTSFAELQARIAPWRRYAKFSEPCGANFCNVEIQPGLRDVRAFRPAYSDRLLPQIYVAMLYTAGVRVTDTSAQIEVRNGYVWEVRYFLHIYVRRRMGEKYGLPILEAKLGSVLSQPPAYVIRTAKSETPEFALDAGHFIRWYQTASVRYTPYAPIGQIRHLTRVNFACVAGIRACREPAQLVPAVAGFEENGQLPDNDPANFACDDKILRVTARDASSAASVVVLSNHVLHPEEGLSGTQLLSLRMVQPLKRASGWKPGSIRTFETWSVPAPPYFAAADLQSGDQAIVIFDGEGDIQPQGQALGAYGCGLVRDTPGTRADVLAGAADDSRVEPYDVYFQNYGTQRESGPSPD
jgi:hypothetical protein